jgi:hypothetical protein
MPNVSRKSVRVVLPVLFLCAAAGVVAQQSAGGPANQAIAPGDQDPNLAFPRGISKSIAQGGAGVSWTYGSYQGGMFTFGRLVTSHASAPYVAVVQEKSMGRAQRDGEYLGFVDGMGSLIFDTQDGAVYSYQGDTETLTRRYATPDDIPEDVLASIHNKRYLYVSKRDRTTPLPAAGGAPAGGAHFVAKPQEPDPNFPPGMGDSFKPQGLPLSWVLNGTQPSPMIGTRDVPPPGQARIASIVGFYLGFNSRGSWIASSADGTVYVWNLASRTLTPAAKSWWEAPRDLANPSGLMQAILYYDNHAYAAAKSTGEIEDPNFPPTLAGLRNDVVPVVWSGGTNYGRSLRFANGILGNAGYLGFDERGAWLVGSPESRVFIFDFKTLTLTDAALRVEEVPTSVLARLKNQSPWVVGAIKNQTGTGSATPTSAPAAQLHLDANAARRAQMIGSGPASAAGSAPQIRGTAVSVTAGVLSFTVNDPAAPDNGQSVSYKVTRSGPAMTLSVPGAPPPAGIAGTWIADDPGNKDAIILFTVKDEHTVVGTVMSGLAAEAMKRMGAGGAR